MPTQVNIIADYSKWVRAQIADLGQIVPLSIESTSFNKLTGPIR